MRVRGNTSSRWADYPIRSSERYEVHIPASALTAKAGEHLLTVRAYDRHDNVGVAKTVFGTASGSAAK